MNANNARIRKLPSRDIAHAYSTAMYFAQRFEENLRDILYKGHYLEKSDALQLTPEEAWHLKSKEGFIDNSICRAILRKLRRSALIRGKKSRDALETFNDACQHRNDLAYWFLAEQDFEKMTPKQERGVIRELHAMALDLYKALQISRALCTQTEYHADQRDKIDRQILKELMLEDAHKELLRQL
jgi:hypothetical protein